MKVYDRDKVLEVAARLMTAGETYWGRIEPNAKDAVGCAKQIIDEVERQCPLPGKPEPTLAPPSGRTR